MILSKDGGVCSVGLSSQLMDVTTQGLLSSMGVVVLVLRIFKSLHTSVSSFD